MKTKKKAQKIKHYIKNGTETIEITGGKFTGKIFKKVQDNQEKWYESTKPLIPTSVNKLVGFASSAKTIISLKGESITLGLHDCTEED